ncbi:DUF5316 domain-containing protein [Bacillus sp. FJAT-29790]|uniref:DUF5316 domain-containing protein n=1 Tax=Bacillus sp. FJAT-29790 TaxID=1895002 RepID=UPI001C23B539|nr:DUF5316 domain-containing protein [Bacillus sp. FJAT-29790]MBU8878784.1 DUF5316 domain-containing protein [Bacillus sp. FJAT-29790]
MKWFSIGIVLSIIGVLFSLVVWGIEKAYLITGGIGMFFVGLSMLFSGSMGSGDQIRANFATESAQDRRNRISTTIRLGLVGLPSIILALLLYFLIT